DAEHRCGSRRCRARGRRRQRSRAAGRANGCWTDRRHACACGTLPHGLRWPTIAAMRAWLGIAAAALLVASAPATARAQAFFYPPASGSVALTPNVEYADADASGRPRVLDVYRPPQPTQEGRAGAPAFIFFTASATPQFRDPWAAGWGRAAAANALVG